MPEPGTKKEITVSEEEKIKKILKVTEQKKMPKDKSSSIEDSILNEIRK